MTYGRFKGKVALVTGSSRGLGRVTAEKLAAEGATVIINSLNTPVDGRLVASNIQQQGGKALYVRADIADEPSVVAMAEMIRSNFGRLDILVHNAAGGCDAGILETTRQEFDRSFLTNTYALVTLARNMSPLMSAGSSIIYVSSFGAIRAILGYAIVGASKAASEAVVRSLALELAPKQIRVNAVRPSVIETVALRSFSRSETYLDLAIEETPIGLGTIEDVANSILMLCSSDANLITGQVLDVDGGWSTTIQRKELVMVPAENQY